jgi:hypothetical protein
MAGQFHIEDGTGSKRKAAVTADNALLTATLPLSAADAISSGQIAIISAQKLLTNRMTDSADSPDMNVDGSVTPVIFSYEAQEGYLTIITQLRIVMNGDALNITSNESRKFSKSYASGLTNGLILQAYQKGNITELFLDPVQAIGDFHMYTDSIVNNIDAISAGIDFLMLVLNLSFPVYLVPGETDKLAMTVQDDLSVADITKFQTFVFGSVEKV